MKVSICGLATCLIVFSVQSCSPSPQSGPSPAARYTYRVVNTYPHDPEAFTQGLAFADGTLYEGTGRYGRSSLRKVDIETGRTLKKHNLPGKFFGEGIVVVGDRIVQLTWRSNVGMVYNRSSFRKTGEFTCPAEGWGITCDGKRLIMSDGTAILRFLDLETFEETGRVEVRDGSDLVKKLNELEYIKDEIYANIYETDRIAKINPDTGYVTGWIDLEGLLDDKYRIERTGVLNGIAYDAEGGRLFVTGKLWPRLFEIKLVQMR